MQHVLGKKLWWVSAASASYVRTSLDALAWRSLGRGAWLNVELLASKELVGNIPQFCFAQSKGKLACGVGPMSTLNFETCYKGTPHNTSIFRQALVDKFSDQFTQV